MLRHVRSAHRARRGKGAHALGPSPNFKWSEVNPHGFGGFTVTVRARAIAHARKLEQLRTEINVLRHKHRLKPTGMHVLSWWRPKWYNVRIGGARFSRHIRGDATDFSKQEVDRLCPWLGGRRDFDRTASRVFAHGGFGQYPAGSRHVDSRGFWARWTSF